MPMDPFTAALADFRQWADATSRKLAGDPGTDAGELLTLFELMRDEMGLARPGDLGTGDLETLLLGIYPREILVLDRDDTRDTVPAVRDFLVYLTDRGDLTGSTAHALERELDQVEPLFADAVLEAPDEDSSGDAGFGEDLAEAFGLPEEMPPVRLPPDAEMAATARRAPLLVQLAALAAWVGRGPGASGFRPVNDNAELTGDDAAQAAAALGVGLPDLDYLRWLALDTGFLELDEDETHVGPGEEAQAWQDADDDETLDIWESVFTFVLDVLGVAASMDPRRARDLSFATHGTALAVALFMTRADGLPFASISELIKEMSVSEQDPDRAAKAWQSWVRAHGDPARMLTDRMTQVGALEIFEGEDEGEGAERVRLTSLGLAMIRAQLANVGVEIPLLRPVDQMTATDLLAVADALAEEQFDAETDAWLALRTPESAARELLAAAADCDPASRMLAVAIVTDIGDPAEPAWRDVLGRPELRGYAKPALVALAGGDPETDAQLDGADLAWLLIDALVADGWDDDDAEYDPATLRDRLRGVIPPGQDEAIFELMARVSHPDAPAVLSVIGQHHPDKKIAKLARKSAYKAASRQASQR
jgi:hypothetical protein